MRVKLVSTEDLENEVEIWSLTIGREYEVIGIEADQYRIVDDTGLPHLFNPSNFEMVDSSEPSCWKSETGAEGERYCYPAEWNAPGFFEDFFDRKEETQQIFKATLSIYFPQLELHDAKVQVRSAPQP